MKMGVGGIDDAWLERLLIASGERVRLLSEARKMRIRAALLAENTRLAQTLRRVSNTATPPARRGGILSVIFSPVTIRSLSVVGAFVIALSGYTLFGGARMSPAATLSGGGTISEKRVGPLGVSWQLSRSQTGYSGETVRMGDTIAASGPVTVTFADGSQTIAGAGAQFSILDDGNGVVLHSGAIANTVTPRAADQPRFVVQSDAGLITVKGTEFTVESNGVDRIQLKTNEGVVAAKNDVQEVDVVAGEQLQLTRGEPLVTELQVPRLSLTRAGQRRLITNSPKLAFAARIVPNGTLIAIDAAGSEYARYTADAKGVINGEIAFEQEGRITLRFLQEDAAAARRSQLSDPLEAEYNTDAFTLRLNALQRSGDSVTISGLADSAARVTVNGTPVTVQSDGSFTLTFALASGQKDIEIVSIDAGGNATTVLQSVE